MPDVIAEGQRTLTSEEIKRHIADVTPLAMKELPPLEHYVSQGVRYAILSKPEDVIMNGIITPGWEDQVGVVRSHYHEIQTSWELIAEFEAPPYRRVPYNMPTDFVGNFHIRLYKKVQ